MAELFFLRHGQRIDHARQKSPDSQPLLEEYEPYDPSLAKEAVPQIEAAASSITKLVQSFPSSSNTTTRKNICIHFSPYLRCTQTADLLMTNLKAEFSKKYPSSKPRFQLLGDFALSEWIHDHMKCKPPFSDSNDAYQMYTPNVKHMKNRMACLNFRPTNTLGPFNGPGLSYKEYQQHIKEYFIKLLATYNKAPALQRGDIIIVITHGYAINNMLLFFLNHPIFNELPECKVNYARRVAIDDNTIIADESAADEDNNDFVWRLFQNSADEDSDSTYDLNLKSDIVYYKTNFVRKDELHRPEVTDAWAPSDFDIPRMSFLIDPDGKDEADITSQSAVNLPNPNNQISQSTPNLHESAKEVKPLLNHTKTFVCDAARDWEPNVKSFAVPSEFELKRMNDETFRTDYDISNHPLKRVTPEVSPKSMPTRDNSVVDFSKLIDNTEIYKPIKLRYLAASEVSIDKLNLRLSQLNLAQIQRQASNTLGGSLLNSSVLDFAKFVNLYQNGEIPNGKVEVVHDDPASYFPLGVKTLTVDRSATALPTSIQSNLELNSIAEQSGYTPQGEQQPGYLGGRVPVMKKLQPSNMGGLSLLAKLQLTKRDTDSEASESGNKLFSLSFPERKQPIRNSGLERANSRRSRSNSVKLIPSIISSEKKGIFYNLNSDSESDSEIEAPPRTNNSSKGNGFSDALSDEAGSVPKAFTGFPVRRSNSHNSIGSLDSQEENGNETQHKSKDSQDYLWFGQNRS